jgi:hypothetical protein
MSIILDGTDGITTPSVTYEGDATINGLTVGRGAGAVATNTAVGASALVANTSGSTNTAVGASALDANTTGQRNVAIGHNALTNNINGGYNTAVGKNSLVTNVSGSYNTGIGEETLNTNTASNNTAIGFASLYSNTTASYQVAIGHRASYSNTTGAYNTSVGNDALYTNTTGGYNTAISAGSLVSNTTGAYNTAVGYQSLFLNTTASNNTAVGYQAGYSNTTGTGNTFVGQQAGLDKTTGDYNTVLGLQAFKVNAGGSDNTIIGTAAGYASTGSNNTFVGCRATTTNGCGEVMTTGSKNTIIGGYSGNQGGIDIRTASNYIVLSDGDGAVGIYGKPGGSDWVINTGTSGTLYCKGVYTFTSASAANVFVTSGGALLRSTSALKYKKDIRNLESMDISLLRPVRYKSKCANDDQTKDHLGVIADEAADAGFEELITRGADGEVEGFQYERLTVVLLKSIQELKAEFDAYKSTHP